MNALAIINKYYSEENELKHILLTHSSVADKALQIAVKHPELHLDTGFLEEAALLHDIGIFMTDASGIQCFGTHPYICHGYLGSELLMKEGYPRHALVCERHTGAGMSLQSIIEQDLPIPPIFSTYPFEFLFRWKNRLFVLQINSFQKRILIERKA